MQLLAPIATALLMAQCASALVPTAPGPVPMDVAPVPPVAVDPTTTDHPMIITVQHLTTMCNTALEEIVACKAAEADQDRQGAAMMAILIKNIHSVTPQLAALEFTSIRLTPAEADTFTDLAGQFLDCGGRMLPEIDALYTGVPLLGRLCSMVATMYPVVTGFGTRVGPVARRLFLSFARA